MSRVPLRGYADFPSVCPGEDLTFRLNCDVAGPVTGELIRLIKGDARPDGPTSREEVVEEFAPVTFDVTPQRTQSGSYVQIPDPAALSLVVGACPFSCSCGRPPSARRVRA